MIKVSNLHKSFGKIKAVRGVSFEAHDGEITGLLGPNGAGKSLLLRLCHGLLRPTGGRIAWSAPEARQRQAMVFQRPAAFSGSVAHNVRVALLGSDLSRDEALRRTHQALERFGIARRSECKSQ